MGLYDQLTKNKEELPQLELTNRRNPSLLRDYAGIFVCAMIVFASISLGFVQIGIKVWFGQEVTLDASWVANLTSMASMALGALIQQKIGGPSAGIPIGNTSVSMPSVEVLPTIPADPYAPTPNSPAGYCSCCGQPMPGATASPAANYTTGDRYAEPLQASAGTPSDLRNGT